MAINNWGWLGNMVNFASNVLTTKQKTHSDEKIAEEDRQSRERLKVLELDVDERLRKLGFSTDLIKTAMNNMNAKEIEQLRIDSAEYLGWLSQLMQNKRLSSQQDHDAWVKLLEADTGYVTEAMKSLLSVIGKTNLSNIGLQNLPAYKVAKEYGDIISKEYQTLFNLGGSENGEKVNFNQQIKVPTRQDYDKEKVEGNSGFVF